jgi:hypothetical protein
MTRTEEWVTLKFSGFISNKHCQILLSCWLSRIFFAFSLLLLLLSDFFSYFFISSIFNCIMLFFFDGIPFGWNNNREDDEEKKDGVDVLSLNDNHCWCIMFFIVSSLPGCSDIDDTMSICTCCPLHVHTNTHTKLC